MWILALIPFIMQAIAIGIDEIYFHYKRGLPLWERIGHPLDTFSLWICLLFPIFVPFSETALKVYCGFAIFSCLMVTKDEFVHKHHCPWAENWLHALLFILHPLTLLLTGFMWPVVQGIEVSEWLSTWLSNPFLLKMFLEGQAIIVLCFFLYQAIFWNVIWKNHPVTKH